MDDSRTSHPENNPTTDDKCILDNFSTTEALIREGLPADAPGANPAKKARRYRERVGMGRAIGAPRFIELNSGIKLSGLGTLGGYVEIRISGTTGWTKCGITNYHVIRDSICKILSEWPHRGHGSSRYLQFVPGRLLAIEGADEQGFFQKFPEETRGNAPITTPDLELHNEVEPPKQPQSGIIGGGGPHRNPSGPGRPEAQVRHSSAPVQTNKHVFGKAFIGSGRRNTTLGFALDWALIGDIPPARQGNNILPPHSAWTRLYASEHCPDPSACGAPLKQPVASRGLCSVEPGERVFKFGLRTGATSGFFCGVPSAAGQPVLGDKPYSIKPTIVPGRYTVRPFPLKFRGLIVAFAMPRDSGSLVFNARGEVVGMVMAASSSEPTHNHEAYIIDILDVFEDIKTLSMGTITDVRMAES